MSAREMTHRTAQAGAEGRGGTRGRGDAARPGEGRTCDSAYGSNPDPCREPANHEGAHHNRWGTTWASDSEYHRPTEETL